MSRRISDETWARIRRDVLRGEDPVARIARRHGVNRSTIDRRAKSAGWRSGAARQDLPLAARLLYDELTAELREGLNRLRRKPRGETAAQAGERAQLVRAHRRALLALLEAEKTRFDREENDAPARGALDLAAARAEILRRLERLAATQAADQAAALDSATRGSATAAMAGK